MIDNAVGPCRDCGQKEGRHLGCQDSCIRKAAWDLTFEGIKAKQNQNDIYDDYQSKKFEEKMRIKGKRHHSRKKGY